MVVIKAHTFRKSWQLKCQFINLQLITACENKDKIIEDFTPEMNLQDAKYVLFLFQNMFPHRKKN